jgi:hypothetical protein
MAPMTSRGVARALPPRLSDRGSHRQDTHDMKHTHRMRAGLRRVIAAFWAFNVAMVRAEWNAWRDVIRDPLRNRWR